MSSERLYTFAAGAAGQWRILRSDPVVGPTLPSAARLNVAQGKLQPNEQARWVLHGVTSNVRYTTTAEKHAMEARQASLGREEATLAALIPIRKNPEWWSLPQEERRRIFEESSHHIQTGIRYLPAIARRLHHCRDLGEHEPFDFLTWFDYAPSDSDAFEELVANLRSTEEWQYVDREVDVRLARDP